MALDTFNTYLFVSSGEQSNKFLTPTYADEIAKFQAQRAQSLTGLTVRIDPIQEGTGDPAPDNIRPISGRTGLTVTAAGKNLFDKTAVTANAWLSTTTGEVERATTPGYVVTDYILVKKGVSVYIPATASVRRWFYDANKTPTTYLQYSVAQVFTPTEDGYLRATIGTNNVDIDTFQIEFGNAHTTYEAYHGANYPISWQTEAGTIYGGTLNVTTGVLTVDWDYIASYNGETLPGEWISDRDVYAEGTTPTTGAEVAYKLAEPVTYQLDPEQVMTVPGFNQIYSNAGPVIDIQF